LPSGRVFIAFLSVFRWQSVGDIETHGGGLNGYTEFRFRESVNRSPVTGVEMRVRSLWGDQPLLSRESSYIPVPLCSGSYEVEFSHPLYQPRTLTYTSPRDRSQSGNTQVDAVEVILTLR
jgi:hypothetical protein